MSLSLIEVMEEYVGRGRPISVEQLAREADTSESTVHRWREGQAVPDAADLRDMLASRVLPAEFRKAMLETLLYRCGDLRVSFCGGEAPAKSCMSVAVEANGEMAALLVKLEESLKDKVIDSREDAELEQRLLRLQRRIQELVAAKNSRRVGRK